MLRAKNLSIGYETRQPVFEEINFSVQPGDFVALLGVNGIGKSTLLRTISGLQKQVSGSITLNDIETNLLSAGEKAKLLSVVLTEKVLIEQISVRQFVALGRAPYTNWMGRLSEADTQELNKVIELMKMQALQRRPFGKLSDGEKQKAMIARALCQQTPVIILDEPTAFLDFRNKREILELLASISSEMNKIVILSTHDIEASLNYCNKFWIMTEGKEFMEIAKSGNYRDEVMGRLFGKASGN
jgi:iron complex transport system ATP-binding protein